MQTQGLRNSSKIRVDFAASMTSAAHFSPNRDGAAASPLAWLGSALLGSALIWMLVATHAAFAQTAPAKVNAATPMPAASAALQPRSGKSLTQPLWAELTVEQQTALRPLYADWASMPVAQKRKWLELAKGFSALAPADQSKYHSRVSAWSALSPQQRAQARLSFADATTQMSADERKSKWQAYQALSPEEKQRLRVAGKGEQTKSIALAPRPVASDRIAVTPKPTRVTASTALASGGNGQSGKTSAKIALVTSSAAGSNPSPTQPPISPPASPPPQAPAASP